MTKFITIISGKGGTGKTTSAINLAAELNNIGRKVTLVDANLSSPDVAHYLGFPQLVPNLHNVLRNESHISKATYLHASGVKIVPASLYNNPEERFPKKISGAVIDLFGKNDIVVIDSAAGLGREVLEAIKPADETIIVTNPERLALFNAKKAISLAESQGSVVIGAILNKVKGNKNEYSASDVKSYLGVPIIAEVPEDVNVKRSLLLKHPVVLSHPNSAASVEFRKLAKLIGEE